MAVVAPVARSTRSVQRVDSLAGTARRGKRGRVAPPADISGAAAPIPHRSIPNRIATWASATVVHSPTRPRQHVAPKTFTLRP
jgi:hypothetical protein